MIQVNDFRLGNLLTSQGKICTVTSLSENTVQIKGLNNDASPEAEASSLEYLPLSEEWMIQLSGAETGYLTISSTERSNSSSDISILSTIECYLHEEGFLSVCSYEYQKLPDESMQISDDVITLGYKHIRYVHQVQNLYFALTGKELEINGTKVLRDEVEPEQGGHG